MKQEKVTLLIIDDKPANIFVLEKLLEKTGRVILSATEATQGLKIALEKKVDLIILDVQMPEMDGFEVARTLKSHRKTKDVPIIFASAERIEKKFILKGFEEGAFDYLQKPLDPEVTRARVEALLKIQSQKKELVEKNTSLKNAEDVIGKLNLELHKNLAQLEIANKDLESFSYSVSHDLRAPVRSILGFSKILEEDYSTQLGSNGGDVLNAIVRNANRMDVLINDLLEFSRLGKKELNKTEINSEEMVRSILDELKFITPTKTSIRVDPLDNIIGDAILMKQVWVNLISNAIKYSSKNKNPEIRITTENSNGQMIFSIKDNGVGFSMQYSDKLFKVFQRLHHENEFEGVGVGLSLVKKIINKHGGKVWAEAKVNEGATFYFSVPN